MQQIVSYVYDAWGNVTMSGTDPIGNLNPLTYRGYVYDQETELYYLQSRYYNPQWGRFINGDLRVPDVGGTLLGHNQFAYCFNNPVNMADTTGNWPQYIIDAINWVNDNIIEPVIEFVDDVVEDIKNYDSNNQSEEVVFTSNYISNYKGVLVIKTPFDASFSYGFIGLSIYQQNSDTLKHEYGHAVQLENMGVLTYATEVAIPSATINLLDRMGELPYDYYSYPWEAEANQLGGSTLCQKGKPKWQPGEYVSTWSLIRLLFK